MWRSPQVIFLLTAMLLLSGCVAANPASGSNSEGSVKQGTYWDAPTNSDPHYILKVIVHPNFMISGALDFEYQDGKVSRVLTFTSDDSKSHFVLRTKPMNLTMNGNVSGDHVVLQNCSKKLKFVEVATTCTFHLISTT
jgi:major membrane immunogen (membrane-anchored lipoprotein)